jgi:pyrimidine-nucleoside phosphorylase
MRTVDIIARKRDGFALSTEEIDFLIQGYTSGTVADYQMAAWAMAVLLRGMDARETADLTLAMARSGEMLDLHDLAPLLVDKHSTGGVGDKTSLVLAPLLAATGLPVAKMSGRGLGFTGGTVDKLESIPGFRSELSQAEFRRAVGDIGLVLAAQSADLAPADKKLYALRDVTATVESTPLIAASIMSKKLAAGADCIVLDVKYGAGAFMPAIAAARELARTMVEIGRHAGRRCAALLTSMQQPLGRSIGNALEVREAVATLQGGGPPDLRELCLALGGELLLLAGRATDAAAARDMLAAVLADGTAWRKFQEVVAFQGGDPAALAAPDGLPHAPVQRELAAPQAGYLAAIDGQQLGRTVAGLGGGRRRKEDRIDPAVGLELQARIGDRLAAGDPLLIIHAASDADAERAARELAPAFEIADTPPDVPSLVAETIR